MTGIGEHCECQGWIGRWPYQGRSDPAGTFRCSDCDRVLAEEYVPASQLRGALEEIERLRDDLEDTRADWARMKGVAERRRKAVEALREVARLLSCSTSTLAAVPTGDERAALTIVNGALERLQKATLGE